MGDLNSWLPKTELGKAVMNGQITSMDEVFKSGKKIKEPEIVEKLLNLQTDIIFIGGSPGKGGGIRRTPTRRTARMHRSGRRYKISAVVAVGNGDGYFGLGKSEAIENRDAINKATENAKLNIIPVKRGCGSWQCGCGESHSIPFSVTGKSGSVKVVLLPSPKGVGLAVGDEAKKIMKLAGIKDLWAKSFGRTKTRVNYSLALFDAFKKLNRTKTLSDVVNPKPRIKQAIQDFEMDDVDEETIEAEENE